MKYRLNVVTAKPDPREEQIRLQLARPKRIAYVDVPLLYIPEPITTEQSVRFALLTVDIKVHYDGFVIHAAPNWMHRLFNQLGWGVRVLALTTFSQSSKQYVFEPVFSYAVRPPVPGPQFLHAPGIGPGEKKPPEVALWALQQMGAEPQDLVYRLHMSSSENGDLKSRTFGQMQRRFQKHNR